MKKHICKGGQSRTSAEIMAAADALFWIGWLVVALVAAAVVGRWA